MAMDGISPALAIRSSVGVELWSSAAFKSPYEQNPNFPRDETKSCATVVFSKGGKYLAWGNGTVVRIVDATSWKDVSVIQRPKAYHLKFSPRGTYLVTWEIYAINKDTPEGSPNMHVYECATGKELFSAIQKKHDGWEPCWSADETLFGLMVGGEAFFYDVTPDSDENFKTSTNKLGGGRNGLLSIAPGNCPPHVAFYVPGTKGAPSMCKIFQYPGIQQNQAVACKSLYQADHVEMLWNNHGNGLLLLTSTDVDQSGSSYYGKQNLHFMSTKGDSFSVQLAKKGPIHAVSWSPKSKEFLVVYGNIPSQTTLFNSKCDPVFEFGEGPHNSCYFNDFGNLLLLAGFGNLQGYVEIWDMLKKVQITKLRIPDTTLLEWSPAGDIFLTATTAPRLRMSNGFKVWHYSGALLHETEWPKGQELLEVVWQKYPDGTLKEKAISNEKIEGIRVIEAEAAKQVYQPPYARMMKEGNLDANGESLLKSPIPGLPPGYTSQKTNSSNSNRQKRARNKNKNIEITRSDPTDNNQQPNTDDRQTQQPQQQNQMQQNQHQHHQYQPHQPHQQNLHNRPPRVNNGPRQRQPRKPVGDAADNTNVPENPSVNDNMDNTKIQNNRPPFLKPKRIHRGGERHYASTGDPEKDKKIRALTRKIQDINKLKGKQMRGEMLEANQLSKIASEAALIQELNALKV